MSKYLGRRKGHERLQLVCLDAVQYRIPDKPSLWYFYNPFQEEVMRKVLENIRRSLAAVPREAYIVYLKPVHRSLMDESGFLTPIQQNSWLAIYKASGV